MNQSDFRALAEQSCLAVAYWQIAKDFLNSHGILTISEEQELSSFMNCLGASLRFHYVESDCTVPLCTASLFVRNCLCFLIDDTDDMPAGLTIHVSKYADKTGGFNSNSYWIEHYKTTGKYGQHFVYLHEDECFPNCIDWRKVTFGGI